jgi:RNA polymerase sigma-54 factor
VELLIMRLDTSMSQRLDQKMILAPRMIQSMEILQLPVMALQERIEHELSENPVLVESNEEAASSDEDFTEFNADEPGPTKTDPGDPQKELVIDDKGGNEQDFDRLLAINEDWSDHFNEEHRPSVNRISEEGDKKHDAMVNMASRPQSLQDHLNEQLTFVDVTPEMLELVKYLLTHVDENGWLTVPRQRVDNGMPPGTVLEEIGRSYGQEVTPAQLEEALAIIQKFDPPGIGARDLRECLLLQLTPETPHTEALRALIQNHLEDIRHNRLPVIQKKTGLALSSIQEGIEALKHLDPRPGARYSSESVPHVVPDIAVERTETGEYEVKLLDDWTPNVYISRRCIEMYRDKNSDPKTREFLKRKIQAAHWLIEAIEQRRNTLAKVTRAIIKHQRAFLDKGPEFIEPLKMQQIAEQVGVHVTTVSRAVDDKWVETPRGDFPLKRFFGGGTQTTTGEEVAWETIKQKLLEIIANEDKSNPLSDEDLVTKLSEAGYPVARRTVTKYRKMLDIASSRQRKVWGQ